MTKTTSYTLLGIGAAILLTFGVFLMPKNENVQADGDAVTREEVKDIVATYIKENPEVIINALNSYQDTQRAEQQAKAREGVKNLKGKLDGLEAPMAGNPDGDVTVIEFFDYNCGFCKRVLPTVQKLLNSDKNVKVLFMEFPILSPTSEQAARGALAVYQVDASKYFDFHNKLMNHSGQKNEEAVMKIATDLGLDKEKVKTAMNNDKTQQLLNTARDLATQAGIRGTPAFIIGDELIPGAVDYNALKAAVDKTRAGS